MAKKFRFKFDFGLRSGANGRDGADGRSGNDGLDGTSPRFRYTKTANENVIPVFVANNINPGSAWGAIIPTYSRPEAVWMILADVNPDNTLKSNWTGPVRISGVDGKDGISASPPNYTILFFKQLLTRPEKPTFTDPNGADTQGWVGYPDSEDGRWWSCLAQVEGLSNLIMHWGEVQPLTGVDGAPGQDGNPGNSREARRAYSSSNLNAPALVRTTRFPVGWTLDRDFPQPPVGTFVWETVAEIDALDNLVGLWGQPVCLSGAQGPAGTGEDAPTTEYRYAKNTSWSVYPTINRSARNPGTSWSTTPPSSVADGEAVWYTWAQINRDNTLYSNWNGPWTANGQRGPIGSTGPVGPPGPTGSNGVSGIPGVSYELRYSLGTANTFTATWNATVATTRNPTSSGWTLSIPTTTETYPYIWMIQARILRSSNQDNVGTLEGTWEVPFRLSGLNGLNGGTGNSQIAYPAGVYSVDVTYITTERVAPYVFDPADNNFYIMNYIGSWLGSAQGGRTPYNAGVDSKGEPYWVKIASHEAIYTKLGIIANGLIGMAVFNREFMFSQLGFIGRTGGTASVERLVFPSTYAGLPLSTQVIITLDGVNFSTTIPGGSTYLLFIDALMATTYTGWTPVYLSGNRSITFTKAERGVSLPTKISGFNLLFNTDVTITRVVIGKNTIPGSASSLYELFNPDITDGSGFTPNMLINFKTGEARFSKGDIILQPDGTINIGNRTNVFKLDGSGWLAAGNILWDGSGNTSMYGRIESSSGKIGGWTIGETNLASLRITNTYYDPISSTSVSGFTSYTIDLASAYGVNVGSSFASKPGVTFYSLLTPIGIYSQIAGLSSSLGYTYPSYASILGSVAVSPQGTSDIIAVGGGIKADSESDIARDRFFGGWFEQLMAEGFHMSTVRSSSTITVQPLQTVLSCVSQSSSQSVILPSNPRTGRMLIVIREGHSGLNIFLDGLGKLIKYDSSTAVNSLSFGPSHSIKNSAVMLIFDGNLWLLLRM